MADNLNDLALIIKSHFPLVQVETSEEVRMMRLLERASNLEGWPLFVWTVADEPLGLWCADNGTLETAKVCIQVFEGLYGLKGGNAEAAPLLATKCEPSADGLTWTCALRTGVRFHNGESFDAGDVLDSFVAQWDCASPLHKGALSTFNYWHLLSPFLNEESCSKPG